MAYCYRHPDRETGLSCSECGKPICYECMTPAPVGLRCPEHSGKPQGVQKVTRTVQRVGFDGSALVTKVLVVVNVGIWLLMVLQGGTLSNPGTGSIFVNGVLYGPLVAHGDWWRLITSAFLHESLIHVGMNMVVLWFIGSSMERAIGSGRFLLIYMVSALAGAAGALYQTPAGLVLGASGAIAGLVGAALIMERQGFLVLGGNAMSLIVINVVFNLAYHNGLSWGGHLGGLIGGALCALVLSRFGRGHAAYSKMDAIGVAGIVGVGVLSVLVCYWRVRGYA